MEVLKWLVGLALLGFALKMSVVREREGKAAATSRDLQNVAPRSRSTTGSIRRGSPRSTAIFAATTWGA
jgi:hypothetical protein